MEKAFLKSHKSLVNTYVFQLNMCDWFTSFLPHNFVYINKNPLQTAELQRVLSVVENIGLEPITF